MLMYLKALKYALMVGVVALVAFAYQDYKAQDAVEGGNIMIFTLFK